MRNFKKTLSFLLSTVIIVSSVVGVGTTVFAATDEHTYKNFKYRILDDNTAEICGYTGKNAVVTVPDKACNLNWQDGILFRQNQGSDNSQHSKKHQMVGFLRL